MNEKLEMTTTTEIQLTPQEQPPQKMIKVMTPEELEKNWPTMTPEQKREVWQYQKVDLAFVTRHYNEVDWPSLSINPFITVEILVNFEHRISWPSICINDKRIADEILVNFRHHMLWNVVLAKQYLDMKCLVVLSEIYRKSRDPKSKIFFKAVSRYQKIDHEYVEAYKRYIDWEELSCNKNITMQTIEKNIEKLNAKKLLSHVTIAPWVLKEHEDYFRTFL